MRGWSHGETRGFWRGIDWTRRNVEIARRVGVAPGTVAYWRQRLQRPDPTEKWAKPEMRARTNRRFAGVDWSLPNIAISRLMGCSREYIRQLRPRFEFPPTHGR